MTVANTTDASGVSEQPTVSASLQSDGASLAMQGNSFAGGVQRFSAWREELINSLRNYATWMYEAKLSDADSEKKLLQMMQRLESDRLSLAFVAEYSRGKSELINAIFFSDLAQRVVPTSAGRTTMCPTEFYWDSAIKPCIRLLPIETRKRDISLSELRDMDDEWRVFHFDPDDTESVKKAFARVSEIKLALVDEAQSLGLLNLDSVNQPNLGMVDIPRWRHAIINYPHALFKQGLRLIDTPGLNAVGVEPELTHSLLPSAHAVVFLLGVDTGVTASDLQVWNNQISPSQARYVALNKIDGLWDDLRTDQEIEFELNKQVQSVANHLSLSADRIFPMSAQKGLVARIHGDQELLRRSRLADFERALANDLLPARFKVMGEQVSGEFGAMVQATRAQLSTNQRSLAEQEFELNSLRGKNKASIGLVATRISQERADFEKAIKQWRAVKMVHTRHCAGVLQLMGMDTLKRRVRKVRDKIRDASFSPMLQTAMRSLLEEAKSDLQQAGVQLQEVHTMMFVMYRQFNTQYAMSMGGPPPLKLDPFKDHIEKLEDLFDSQFGAASLLTREKWVLARRYFELIALELKKVYASFYAEADSWLKSTLSPVEREMLERQIQLKRRMDSVKQVLEASDELDVRLSAIKVENEGLEAQLNQTAELSAVVYRAIVAGGKQEPLQAPVVALEQTQTIH
jgi:Dynamin family